MASNVQRQDEPSDLAKSADEIRNFPFRKLYFFVIFILTLLSPIGLSLQTDDASTQAWKVTATVQITSITVTFLILAWLPLLIPWLVSLSPRLQTIFAGFRESGLEEIEAGILRIKFSPGVNEAAETYKKSLEEAKKNPNVVDNAYQEALASIDTAQSISPKEALTKIDELAAYYDRIRQTMPSSGKRTALLTDLSSLLWTFISRVNSADLNVRERLNSPSGGKRLSAYKYLEYAPSTEYLNLLLSRAVGILEEPFGQFSALLALRRLVFSQRLDDAQRMLIRNHLGWSVGLGYMGQDRAFLMKAILSLLEKNA